ARADRRPGAPTWQLTRARAARAAALRRPKGDTRRRRVADRRWAAGSRPGRALAPALVRGAGRGDGDRVHAEPATRALHRNAAAGASALHACVPLALAWRRASPRRTGTLVGPRRLGDRRRRAVLVAHAICGAPPPQELPRGRGDLSRRLLER